MNDSKKSYYSSTLEEGLVVSGKQGGAENVLVRCRCWLGEVVITISGPAMVLVVWPAEVCPLEDSSVVLFVSKLLLLSIQIVRSLLSDKSSLKRKRKKLDIQKCCGKNAKISLYFLLYKYITLSTIDLYLCGLYKLLAASPLAFRGFAQEV